MNIVRLAVLALTGLLALPSARAVLISEKFIADPTLSGWQLFGETNLFQWNSTNQNMEVTWDSAQTNSYFYHSLGATFTKADGFCIQFDLNLTDVNATGYFELAVGLCNFADATSPSFSRANAASPNLFEFDYYPDGPDSWGPSMDATLIDQNSLFYFVWDDTQPMLTDVVYRVVLIHQPGSSSISGTVLTNEQVFSTLPEIGAYGANDFQLDTLSINNYTTLDDNYGDSLLAHGTVDNLSFASPLPIDKITTIGAGQVQFGSDTNWLYTLEQSTDLKHWTAAAPASQGNGTNLLLQATNITADAKFYRVRAELP